MNKPLTDSNIREVFANWQPEPPADLFPEVLARHRRRAAFPWVWAAAAGLLLALGTLWLTWPANPTHTEPSTRELAAAAPVEVPLASRENPAESPDPSSTSFVIKQTKTLNRSALPAEKTNRDDLAQTAPETTLPTLQPVASLAIEAQWPKPHTALENVGPLNVGAVDVPAADVRPARWLAWVQGRWKPAQALQVARVRYGDNDRERLLVRCETPWFTYSHETQAPRLAIDSPISLLNPQ